MKYLICLIFQRQAIFEDTSKCEDYQVRLESMIELYGIDQTESIKVDVLSFCTTNGIGCYVGLLK